MMVILWFCCFLFACVMLFRRPVWGIALYMQTFFAFPPMWWWGESFGDYRWNLIGGIGLLIAALVSGTIFSLPSRCKGLSKNSFWLLVAIVINATLVHYLLSAQPETSEQPYNNLLKFSLLQLLIAAVIRTRNDFMIALVILAIAAGYIGYEVTINDRGSFREGRLEGVGAPGAANANELASLMITVLPLAGAIIIGVKGWKRLVGIVMSPLILNVIVECSSRGAMLGGVLASGVMVFLSPRAIRKQIIGALVLGCLALAVLAGNTRLVERFNSIFVGEDERDASASNRLIFWRAGLYVLADHPLGSGGAAFKNVHGRSYIYDIEGEDFGNRAIHNGYINESVEWGIQGLTLHLAMIGICAVMVRRQIRSFQEAGDVQMGILGSALLGAIAAFMVTSMFGDKFDAEWGYWCCGLAMAYGNLPTEGGEGQQDGVLQ
ncbi:O-Antigen ligase [Planctomycetes bacterium CA13]|uniref:O-Antigen ligase n=1 Tax=Novipirellula herctigrandis TaxID=2527986 RepID=A0A5C5Z183_9BACT|nr:O-Antigen ligase [Planctomycetes bacterium CA13]